MNISCPKCGVELELPDAMCENGMHFKCYQCASRFSYFNGQIFELKNESPSRIPLPQSRANESRGPYSRRKGTTSKADMSVMRRIGHWWCGQTVRNKRFYKIATGIVCVVIAISMFRGSGEKNELESKLKHLQKLEMRYGTNSVEYIEARIDLIRNFTLVMNKGMVEKHHAFLKVLDRAGYIVTDQQYADYKLVSLLVVNKNTSDYGFMRKGISEDRFSYPQWLSAEDARLIWEHFYFEAMNSCERSLANTERLIEDLESQLKRLKEFDE